MNTGFLCFHSRYVHEPYPRATALLRLSFDGADDQYTSPLKMLCEECQQQPATVFLTQIMNGHETTRHFCEACADQIVQALYQQMNFEVTHVQFVGGEQR